MTNETWGAPVGVALYGQNGHQISPQDVIHSGAQLVATCECDATAALAPVYETLDDLLAVPQVQLVCICAPQRATQHEAILCALERGDGGRAYFITDREGQTFREFVASLASVQGLSIDKLRSIPYWLASSIGRLLDAIWAVTRKDGDPPISHSMIRMIGRAFTVNDAAARRELGYIGRTSRADGLQGYGEPSARR